MLAASLLVTPAVAADKPKPKPTDSNRTMVRSVLPTDTFKAQIQAYKDEMAYRQATIDAINEAFAAAVKRAQRDYKSARTAATTAEAKNAADAARKADIAAATSARKKALDDLGPAPEKPVKPSPAPTATP